MPINKSPVLLDVRPKNRNSVVSGRQIDLRKKIPPAEPVIQRPHISTELPVVSLTSKLLGSAPRASMRDIIVEEVERALSDQDISIGHLAKIGAEVHQLKPSKAKPLFASIPKPEHVVIQESVLEPEPVFEDSQYPEVAQLALSDEQELIKQLSAPKWSATSWNGEQHLQNFWVPHTNEVDLISARLASATIPETVKRKFSKKKYAILAVVLLAGAVTLFATISSRGLLAKETLLQNGANAVQNLNVAKQNLESFDFKQAADHFALAADDFDRASGVLGKYGASFLSVVGDVPGINKISSANNLVEAGRNLSLAGENLALAFNSLYKTNFFSIVNSDGLPSNVSISKPLSDFKQVLLYARSHILRAEKQLSSINFEVIPEEKRILFEEFKSKVPDFKNYISAAIEYSDFLLKIVGTDKPKTYLVLLQNTNERRATGGFPGTYAIIGFDKGALNKIFVDDVYNIDGQMKANMIPPIPLQHITPNLGMRDVNWFADFPTSASKIEEYYRLDGGAKLDGVFAISPSVISKILAIIGPVELDRGMTMTSENFMTELQNEIEYVADRSQPKKIMTEFQPKFFSKLASSDKDQWIEVMKVLLQSVTEKHILTFFNDAELQKQSSAYGFSGEIVKTSSDFLQVIFSNVKGSKTDAVTSNKLNLSTVFHPDSVAHNLTVKRIHSGGTSKYGFYNLVNSSYVRVYLPKGAVFDEIKGNDTPGYKPLVNYQEFGFKADELLKSIENTMSHPSVDVDVFEESGKTVIGYWQNTKPQKTSEVTISYHIPLSIIGNNPNVYELYWQKQSGSQGDAIHWTSQVPNGSLLSGRDPWVQVIGDTLIFDASLDTDQQFKVQFQ